MNVFLPPYLVKIRMHEVVLLFIQAKFEAEMEQMSVPGSQFAVSQQAQSAKGAVLENATDIKVS